jgi:hypothetical protein
VLTAMCALFSLLIPKKRKRNLLPILVVRIVVPLFQGFIIAKYCSLGEKISDIMMASIALIFSGTECIIDMLQKVFILNYPKIHVYQSKFLNYTEILGIH